MSASTRCAQSAPKGGIVNSCGESVWCAGCALGLSPYVGRPLGEATDPIALAAHRVAQLARGVAHAL